MDGRQHTLDADATIGREGCDVVLQDSEVSRRHAALRLTTQGPAVEDFGSTNGTFVNGERVDGVRQLIDGDVLRFGSTEWQLRAIATAEVGAAPQVTAARPIPAQPAAAPAQAPQPAPPAPQPAAPAAPQPVAGAPQGAPQAANGDGAGAQEGRRGDVQKPPEITPSAIRRTIPQAAASAPPAFAPVGTKATRGSAATRAGYTAFCMLVFLAALVGVAVYFIVN